jgi:hypothetical protein
MRVVGLCLCLIVLAGCPGPHVAPEPPLPPGPVWTPWPPLRDASGLEPVVRDIESHLPAGHPYRSADRINWVHEGTHGINGRLRSAYRRPGFYVLNDNAVLLREPPTTLAAVAALVPPMLRGEVYNEYLCKSQAAWNDQPSYIFDEWTAYTNGLEARCRLGISDREETGRHALEFIVYAICVPWAAHSQDAQTKAFLRWQAERTLALCRQAGIHSAVYDRLRTTSKAAMLRGFIKRYLGPDWTRRTLGF